MYLSVIMPVYNGEKGVAESIESVLAQSFRDYEFIIVDDGSTDRTGQILEEYAKKDERIKVLHQENQGVSAARNYAMEQAAGKYIAFVDADDLLLPEAFTHMHQIAVTQGGTMIVGQAERIDGVSRYEFATQKRMTQSIRIRKDNLNMLYNMTCWLRWFSRKTIMDHDIRFPLNKHLSDGVFTYRFLKHADNITTCPHLIYTYRKDLAIENKSITGNISPELFRNTLISMKMLEDLTQDYGKEFRDTLNFRFMQTFISGLYYRKLWKFNKEGQKVIRAKMEELYPCLSEDFRSRFDENNRDIFREGKAITVREFIKKPLITIAVRKMTPDHIRPFLQCLYDQNLPSFVEWMDHKLKASVPKAFQDMPNLFFRKRDVFKMALDKAKSPYVTFVEDDILYEMRSIHDVIRRMEDDETIDGVSEKLVSMKNGKCETIQTMEEAYEEGQAKLDLVLSNKIFRRKALLENGFSWSLSDEDQAAFLCEKLRIDKSARPCMITMAPDEIAMIKTKEGEAVDDPEETVNVSFPEAEEPAEKAAAMDYRTAYRDDYYLNDDIRYNLVLMIGRKEGPSELLTEIARCLSGEEYGNRQIYYPADKEDFERVSEYFERELPGKVNVIRKKTAYVRALARARLFITEEGMPYWWIKKPGQILTTIWTDEKNAREEEYPFFLHRNYFLSDYLFFMTDRIKEQRLENFSYAPHLKGKLIEASSDSTEERANVICDELTGKTSLGRSLKQMKSNPLFLVSKDLDPEGTGLIREWKERNLLPENSCLLSFYYMAMDNPRADREIGEILPLVWLRGLPHNSYTARRYWLGGRSLKKIIILDCDNPLLIRSFARFSEESVLLVNDSLYDQALAGDERSLFALRVFKRAGNGIFMRDEEKAGILSELIGTEVETVRSSEDLAGRLF